MAGYQFSPFDVGQIAAHIYHGLGPAAIARILVKPDGKSMWSVVAISGVIQRLQEQPHWRGERCVGSGAPRKTTKKQDRELVKYVLAQRGRQKITVARAKRQFPYLRALSNSLVEDRLAEAELAFLRRRRKSKVSAIHLPARVEYCHAVKRKRQSTLEGWAYTDGTVYYLDRTKSEHEHSEQAALGAMVWRRTDGRDAMYQECLAPSEYNKAQGRPIRVWGMLACGHLSVFILEEGEVMNQTLYCELIAEHFEDWMGDACYLVCDFERCLRTAASVAELGRVGLELVEGYPPCSQDFNAIENAWDIVKKRLDDTLPRTLETRAEFIHRYRGAVKWVNRNRKDDLWRLSINQKERADACLATKPPGGRTKF